MQRSGWIGKADVFDFDVGLGNDVEAGFAGARYQDAAFVEAAFAAGIEFLAEQDLTRDSITIPIGKGIF